MANLIDQITIGDVVIAVLDSDPSTTSFASDMGSIAIVPSIGKLFHKIGPLSTDWDMIATKSQMNELAQDSVAAALQNSPDLQFTYNDGAGQITANLTSTGVTAGAYGTNNKALALQVDAKGRISTLSENLILMPAAQISDFGSAVESVVGFQKANIETLDAVETVLLSKVVPANKSMLVKAYIVAMDSSNQGAVYERSAAVRNNNGAVSKVGQTQSNFTEETAGTEGLQVAIEVTGSLVQVRVTGLASTTIKWHTTVQFVVL